MTKGVVFLGALSFVFGATVFSLMIYILIIGEPLQSTKDKNLVDGINVSSLPHAFGLHLNKKTKDLIVYFVILISLLKMMFSVLLLIGIKKSKPGYVLSYFSFTFLLCLLLLITVLLELVQHLWRTAIVTAVFTFYLMERLSSVYSLYEDMEKESDSNLLLDDEEFNDLEPIDNIICN